MTKKKCGRCGIIKDKNEFYTRGSKCKQCRSEERKEISGTRQCKDCKEIKNEEEFPKHDLVCKNCINNYNRMYYNEMGGRETKQNNYLENRTIKNKKIYEKLHGDDYKFIVKHMTRECKRRAKDRKKEFNLDASFMIDLYEKQNGKCAITGIDFNFAATNQRWRPFGPSIDRIDCKKGYTKDNVRFVCTIVNISLSDFGEEIFSKMCFAYVNKQTNYLTGSS